MANYMITPSPHIASKDNTSTIMRDVIIALVPALIASVIVFGIRALIVTAVCVISCVVFEYLCRRLMKRDQTISDLSAVVTGMLLAFNLPVSIPLWIAVIGSFVAIVVVKQLFGGIGQNFANPALTARIVLFVSFASRMTHWTEPFNIDAVSSATPLIDIKGADTLSLFLGNVAGCLGETSALALLLGGAYLVIRKVIKPTIPVVYIGTVFVLSWAFGSDPVNQIFAGGLMIGAIFMATDYATSPMTTKGQIIYAVGCGLMTACIRVFGNYPEGVSFSILFMNILTPLIDRATKSKPFGTGKEKEPKEKFDKKKIIVPTVVLTVIGGFIAAILAFTYNATGVGDIPPGLSDEERKEFAYVLGEAKELEAIDFKSDDESFIAAYKDPDNSGVALYVNAVGYAGKSSPMKTLVGFDQDGNITGVAIVSNSETPGLGTRATEADYLKNYEGISGSADEVDTITGATISSTALRTAVNYAIGLFEDVKGEVF